MARVSGRQRIVIAGGGASGLCAGVLLARNGFPVTVLEKTDTAGKKLSMTGNGRCNLSNLATDASCYNEAARPLIEKLLPRAGVRETVAFFREIGVLLRNEEGYLYPVSGRAKQVVASLLDAFLAAGGRMVYGAQLKRVTGAGPFRACTADEAFDADCVILATGGLSGPKTTASTGDGYYIASDLGMEVTERFPALVRLLSDDKTLPADTGVRARARVTFLADGVPFAEECGEVQLTAEGISGIPVLQAGAEAAKALSRGASVTASLDFFPDVTEEAWEALASSFAARQTHQTAGSILNGVADARVNEMVLSRAGIETGMPFERIAEKTRRDLMNGYRALRIRITGTADYTQAQATAGGVALSSLSDTLESLKKPGIYCIGELADVDGRCGGFNLQWAWTGALVVANDISSKYDQNNANQNHGSAG